jgi:hypothetical protein
MRRIQKKLVDEEKIRNEACLDVRWNGELLIELGGVESRPP